jgi:RAB protein geranylgeranyltransferase component A
MDSPTSSLSPSPPHPSNTATTYDPDGRRGSAEEICQINDGASGAEDPVNVDGNNADVDDEGLFRRYDVAICGTGLVQSAVAAACARAGKSVLHLDGSDHYGELDAVWTLPYLLGHDAKSTSYRRENRHNEEEEEEEEDPTTLQLCAKEIGAKALREEDSAVIVVPLHEGGAGASLQIHSMKELSAEDFYPLRIGTRVSTPFGLGSVQDFAFSDSANEASERFGSLTILLDDASASASASAADSGGRVSLQPSPKTMLHVGLPIPEKYKLASDASSTASSSSELVASLRPTDLERHRIAPIASLQSELILKRRSRSIALDVTPSLLNCAGTGVQALVDSQVSDYLEFKALNGLLWYESAPVPSKDQADGGGGRLKRVPCSKSDVFASDMLSPMDKRRLMKFLQLALDYAVMVSDEEEEETGQEETGETVPGPNATSNSVESLNERLLNRGRSLPRPQNKAVAASDLSDLRDCIRQQMPFETYLKTRANLSDHLASVVQHALALILSEQSLPRQARSEAGGDVETKASSETKTFVASPYTTSLREGMERLCLHVASLGKFGPTGFLVPVFGSGELPQAFCRSAAVFGATYLLRRPPRGIVIDESKDAVAGIVLDSPVSVTDGGNDIVEASDAGTRSGGRRSDWRTKQIACDHVVVPLQSLPEHWLDRRSTAPSTHDKRFVLRRISVLRGKCVRTEQRDVPNLQQQQQQQLVIFPPGSVDPLHLYPIHALLLDDQVSVAPRVPSGCTVAHLTTVSSEASKADRLLSEAVRCLLSASSSGGTTSEKDEEKMCQEIFHASFSYRLDNTYDYLALRSSSCSLPSGLHIVPRSHAGVGNEEAFELARRIFRCICTDEDFMKVAPKVAERALLAGNDGEDDDEQRILDTAMESIGQGSKDSASPPQENAIGEGSNQDSL